MKGALAVAYGRQVEYLGPVFQRQQIRGSEVVLHFSHAAGGLVAKDGPLSGFAVAGAEGKFFFAKARIEGDRVVVSSPSVAKPLAVRYGWADYPRVNLFNGAGIPASPFRTDRFPLPPAR
jgi:sialate O-acetylesterase